MDLDKIRTTLQDCEYSIIYALLERSRWKYQPSLYLNQDSLFYQLLRDTETIHEKAGRYNSPEEHPFTAINYTNHTPKHYLYHQILESTHKSINHNVNILTYYTNSILPMICQQGQDENMGSAITADINLLQAISRRCHLGKVVAAIKLKESIQLYQECQTKPQILQSLTNTQVEKNILSRIIDKTTLVKHIAPHAKNINASSIQTIFTQLMTITKDIQVDYISQFLEYTSPISEIVS